MPALELVVTPLDLVRGKALRFAARSKILRRVLARRDTRIAALGTLQVLLLLVVTVWCPVALYFVGPLVLGVAHLAADVRYLVLRTPLPAALLRASAGLALAIAATRAATAGGLVPGAYGTRVDVLLGASWVVTALVFRFRSRPVVATLATAAVVFLAALAISRPRAAELALTHGHNVIAFVLWIALFRRKLGWGALPIVAVIAATLLLLTGACQSFTLHHGGMAAFGVSAQRLAASFAPGVGAELGLSITMTLVFLQAVHYGVWTGLVPQECLRGEGSPTFRMTARSLVADFRPWGVAAIAAVMAGFVAVACRDLRGSVAWYMTLARPHVWLELAMLAFLVGRRGPVAISRLERATGEPHPPASPGFHSKTTDLSADSAAVLAA